MDGDAEEAVAIEHPLDRLHGSTRVGELDGVTDSLLSEAGSGAPR